MTDGMIKCQTEIQKYRWNDSQPKSNIAPSFGAIMTSNNPNIDPVNINAKLKFGEILSICSVDI